MTVELVPRWLWQEVKIPQSGEIVIDPSTFANNTTYPMRLHWLSICGNAALSGAPYDNASGGVTRRMNVEVGITGYSDINLVPMVGTAFFCAKRYRQKDFWGFAGGQSPAEIYLPRALRIPRDSGLVVDVQNIEDLTTIPALYEPSIVAHGYYDRSKLPGFLAGRMQEDILVGGPLRFNSSDLLNRGREDFIITSISVDTHTYTGDIETGITKPQLTNVAWRINPATGIQWMPQPGPIPLGCIAPFTRVYDQSDEGPKAYEFPKQIVLAPRQRLGVKFTDLSTSAQTVYVCLHGELEVQ